MLLPLLLLLNRYHRSFITTFSLALLSPIVLSCNQQKIRRVTESTQNADSVWATPAHFQMCINTIYLEFKLTTLAESYGQIKSQKAVSSHSFYVVAGFGKLAERKRLRDRNFQETFQTCNSSTLKITKDKGKAH